MTIEPFPLVSIICLDLQITHLYKRTENILWMPHCQDLQSLISSSAFSASVASLLRHHCQRWSWHHTQSLPNLGSLAAGKPTEDGGRSQFAKIKDKDASRAGSERGYRLFSSILIFLSFLRAAQLHLKGFQTPHTAVDKIKHMFSMTCSTCLWLKWDFNQQLFPFLFSSPPFTPTSSQNNQLLNFTRNLQRAILSSHYDLK